jgi:hypothetical protein
VKATEISSASRLNVLTANGANGEVVTVVRGIVYGLYI